ncbi:hypothetical protein M3Y99_00368600 [Aphelenchoides fujianensis]|nr:hypothetical protein M3Y99_00368600 [Aphelenchoides fujianensis]
MPPGDPPNGTSTAASNPTILCRLLVGHDTWLLDRPTDSEKTAHSDVEYFVEVKDPPKDFASLAFKHGGRFKHKADGQQSASKSKKPEGDERRKKSNASSVDVPVPKKAAVLSVSSKKLPAGPPSTSSDEHRPRPSTSESSRTEDKSDKPHRSHHHKEHKKHKEHKGDSEEKSKHRHHKDGEEEKRRKSKKSKKERQPKEAEAIRPPSSASSAVSRATFNETNDEQEERRARDAAKAARPSAEERPPKRPRSPSPLPPPPPTDAPKRPKLEAMPSPDNLFESASPDDFRAFTPDVLDRVDELAAAPAPMLSPLGKLTTLSVASTSPSIDGGMGRDEAHWRRAYELGRSLIAPLHADHFELGVLHKSGDLADELADRFERPTPARRLRARVHGRATAEQRGFATAFSIGSPTERTTRSSSGLRLASERDDE